jgi:hypothetical protein
MYLFAQPSNFIIDKEGIFNTEEIKQIDSVLQAGYKLTGNFIGIYTDTADVSIESFGEKVVIRTSINDNAYSFILMMSRHHGLIFATVNKMTAPYTSQQLLVALKQSGTKALANKELAKGVLQICSNALLLLNLLPKQ